MGRRRGSNQERVAVIQVEDEKRLDEHLCRLPGEEGTNPPDDVKEESTGATAVMFAKNDSSSSRVTPSFLTVRLGSATVLSW